MNNRWIYDYGEGLWNALEWETYIEGCLLETVEALGATHS